MEFFNREKEIRDLLNMIRQEPNMITFIYGPINSGKTSLMLEVINRLPKEYVAFYINLRRRYVIDDKSFVRVLFRIRREKDLRGILEEIVSTSDKVLRFFNIPIPANILKEFLKEKPIDDVFEFLEDFFLKISEKKRIILILDELQVIKDIKINEFLIYKLFNFLVSLTKVLHICHVFAITSDSTFIERIYNEAMLQDRAKYYLVDDFNKETVVKILRERGFSSEEIDIVWEYFGGKPIHLVEAIQMKKIGKDIKVEVEKMVKLREVQVKDRIEVLKFVEKRVRIEGKEIVVDKNRLLNLLSRFRHEEIIPYEGISPELLYLIENNILFLDPVNYIVKPQSKLTLNAIRNLMK